MKWFRLLVIVTLVGNFLLLADSALTQSVDPNSSELWTDVGIRLELSSKAKATFTQKFRFNESMLRNYLSSPELEIRYKLMDRWYLEGGYRYENVRDNDGVFVDRYRIFANTRFLAKYKPVMFEFRLQWQKEFRQNQDDGTPTRHILRTRLKAKLRRTPIINPYASIEMFQRLDGFDEDIPAGTIQKWRFGLGMEWQCGPVDINARYYLVSPSHDPQDPTRHILSLGLQCNLSPWKN
ncbi:MAG: DUF2490 domain-containing protein [candidate division Zixibacteria bacterium]|nr:DUF2490 domain-containing protein [candidate division Zixibacteria bacterium]